MTKDRKRARKPFGVILAYVRWFDSAIYKGEAYSADEVTGYLENESSGLLVEETKDSVTIALDRCLETKNLRLVLCVPKANIRAMRKFKV
jgi:hypothetical protein